MIIDKRESVSETMSNRRLKIIDKRNESMSGNHE